MPGVWDEWPTHWRSDRAIMERICPCGVGHPAAEEYMLHNYAVLMHGCCHHACIPDLNNLHASKLTTIDGEVVTEVLGDRTVKIRNALMVIMASTRILGD
jgi:hypothetical protein